MLGSVITFWWYNFIWISKKKQREQSQNKIKLLGRDTKGKNSDEKEKCLPQHSL